MDSVTQLVLGASVGHAVAGKSAGKKALIAGAIGGTIPDLDVVFYPLLDSMQQIGFHRGISHSFFFVVLASPLFGWIARKVARDPTVPYSRWVLVGFWALFTHVLLDAMTVYGTGLLEPFSKYRVAFNAIFIIDPAYTVPIVIGLIPVVLGFRNRAFAWRFNVVGLALSTIYLGWALIAKGQADRAFEAALHGREIMYSRMITMPTPLNTLLWRSVVETEDGFLEAYYSVVAGDEPMFQRVEDGPPLTEPWADSPAVRTIAWFSNGFYVVDRYSDEIVLHDLRFGRLGLNNERFVFTFEILSTEEGPGTAIRQVPPSFEDRGRVLGELWDRIFGRT